MICGTVSAYAEHLRFIDQVIGMRPGAKVYAAMNVLLLDERMVALVDTHVNDDPTAEQIAEFTVAAAEEMTRLNLVPKVALLSRPHFGTGSSSSGAKMREALALVRKAATPLEIAGQMTGLVGLDRGLRMRLTEGP